MEKCEEICKYAPWGWKYPCCDCYGYSKAEPKEPKLVTWDEFKREREYTWEYWEKRNVACPVCGEAIEERADIAYTSDIANFPFTVFRCTKCGWSDRAKEHVYFTGR